MRTATDRGDEDPLDARPVVHDLRRGEPEHGVAAQTQLGVVRDVTGAVCRRRVIGPAVDLDDEVRADHEVHVVAGQMHLEAQAHAPAAQPHVEDRLQRGSGVVARVLGDATRSRAAPLHLLQGIQGDRLGADRRFPDRRRLVEFEALRCVGECVFHRRLQGSRPSRAERLRPVRPKAALPDRLVSRQVDMQRIVRLGRHPPLPPSRQRDAGERATGRSCSFQLDRSGRERDPSGADALNPARADRGPHPDRREAGRRGVVSVTDAFAKREPGEQIHADSLRCSRGEREPICGTGGQVVPTCRCGGRSAAGVRSCTRRTLCRTSATLQDGSGGTFLWNCNRPVEWCAVRARATPPP